MARVTPAEVRLILPDSELTAPIVTGKQIGRAHV